MPPRRMDYNLIMMEQQEADKDFFRDIRDIRKQAKKDMERIDEVRRQPNAPQFDELQQKAKISKNLSLARQRGDIDRRIKHHYSVPETIFDSVGEKILKAIRKEELLREQTANDDKIMKIKSKSMIQRRQNNNDDDN